MSDTPDATRDQLVKMLTPLPGGGYKRPYASRTIEVSFLTAMPTYSAHIMSSFATAAQGGPRFAAFSEDQQVRIKKIFADIEKVADVRFVYPTTTPSAGAIRFGIGDLRVQDGTTNGKKMGGYNFGAWNDRQTPVLNDIILDADTLAFDPTLPFGGGGYTTLIHEVGHALGLKHPTEATASTSTQLSRAVAVMSYADYVDGSGNPLQGVGIYGMTPLTLDILALQELWLKNTSNLNDSTPYKFDPDATLAKTNNSDTTIYRTQIRTLWDTNGIDTLDASAYVDPREKLTIDLRPGYLSSIGGNKNIGIAFDAVIENATGGAGNDILNGNDVANILIGGTGSDILEGGKDTDTYTFNGTWGNDVIADSDGLGKIEVDGTTLSGGKKTSANTYQSADKKYRYQLNTDGSLVIHQKGSNNAITIRDWSQGVGKLGITLDDTPFNPTAPDARGVQMLKGDQRAPIATNAKGLAYYDWAQPARVAEANFADVLKAGSDGSVLYGYGGNDALGGGAGADDIFGGDGHDLICGGAGADNLRGGAGDDRIYGSSTVTAYDRLFVGETWGAEQWRAYGRNPLKPGQTVAYAEATYGVYKDAQGVELFWGVSQDLAQTEGDTVDGGSGNDWIYASNAADTLDGGDDNDIICGLGGADQIEGGKGNDALFGDRLCLESDASCDLYFGVIAAESHGADVIDGGAGDDNIVGGGGDDQLFGGADADTIRGDDTLNNLTSQYHGSDVIFGGSGDDRLFGDGGDDLLFGGDDNDYLDGGTGADRMDGGAGSNTYVVDNVGDVIVGPGSVVSGAAQMLSQSASSAERVTAQSSYGVQSVEASISYTLGDGLNNLKLTGSDSINGTGNALNNSLTGNAGNNVLFGGEGHDRLESGAGDDKLDGGTGNDTFVIAATGGVKHIVDSEGVDMLLLQDWKVSNLQVALQGGSLVLSDTLSGTQVSITGVDVTFSPIESFQLQDDAGNAIYLTASQMLGMGGGQVGTAGDDVILGTTGDDTIDALGGQDTVRGGGGNDTLRGGAGIDKVYGDAGNDTLIGGVSPLSQNSCHPKNQRIIRVNVTRYEKKTLLKRDQRECTAQSQRAQRSALEGHSR